MMVARTRPTNLTVAFWRDNQCLDTLPARTGERALLIATMLLEEHGADHGLQHGDYLLVTAEQPDNIELPAASRSSHYS